MTDEACKVCLDHDIADMCYHSKEAAVLAQSMADAYGNGQDGALGWIDSAEELSGLVTAPFDIQRLPLPSRSCWAAMRINDMLFAGDTEDTSMHLVAVGIRSIDTEDS